MRCFLPTSYLFLAFTFSCASTLDESPLSGDSSGANGSALGGSPATPSGAAGSTQTFIDDGDCGNSQLDGAEQCDDGNDQSGDGCAEGCERVEPGFACPKPGKPCIKAARCGDGLVTAPEQCDDGSLDGGNGCSERCRLEPGYKCEGDPSQCSETICGDGIREGLEGCDDGNTQPLDGCSADCTAEPQCNDDGCTSACGDALVVDEECDDGNTTDGDGCSATCLIEAGATCSPLTAQQTELRVPIIYRDFMSRHEPGGHPDFDFVGEIAPPGKLVAGIVKPSLNADGKPELSDTPSVDAFVSDAANFADWYGTGDLAQEFLDELVLTRQGDGFAFSERAFFPLDGRGWSTLGEQPRDAYVPPEWLPGGSHYFFFTSELKHWFRYDPEAEATLSFTGDDDVWVFVNRRLVVDLGGIHAPQSASFALNDALTDTQGQPLGLQAGAVYEITLFQAERNPGGSSYELELSGFDASPSECLSACGDGTVSAGLEECDDGNQESGDGCSATCSWELGLPTLK